MTPADHSASLGEVVHNLQALETWLRLVLLKLEPSQHSNACIDFEHIRVGELLAKTELTNYDDLATLIRRFNRKMEAKGSKPINLALVDLRDAIAHGRVLGTKSGFPLRLVKFSKPSSGQVKLVVNELMSYRWFNLQIRRTNRAIEQVRAEA